MNLGVVALRHLYLGRLLAGPIDAVRIEGPKAVKMPVASSAVVGTGLPRHRLASSAQDAPVATEKVLGGRDTLGVDLLEHDLGLGHHEPQRQAGVAID